MLSLGLKTLREKFSKMKNVLLFKIKERIIGINKVHKIKTNYQQNQHFNLKMLDIQKTYQKAKFKLKNLTSQ
jgi:hypothetical protein